MYALHTGNLEGGSWSSPPTGEPAEGELWARDALDRLRARRFSTPGVVELLAASLARARRTRDRRPDLVARSRRLCAAGLVAAAPLGPRAVVRWLGWGAMLDWHLGMAETAGGEPWARALGTADAVTLLRLWAAPLARRTAHPAVIALASATDVVDGLLARRAGPTRLGRDLDSAADASFFHAALGGLVERGRLAPWLLAAERAHLLVVLAAGVASYLGTSTRPATPEGRAIPACLGATGLLLAATTNRRDRGGSRPGRGFDRWSHGFVAGAIAARTLRGLRGAVGARRR